MADESTLIPAAPAPAPAAAGLALRAAPASRSHFADLPSFRLVRTPDSARTLARVLSGLLVVSLVGLIVTPWQQTAVGSGRIIAYAPLERQQTIEAPLEGRLQDWHVQEGSRVRKGDRIATINDNDPTILMRLGQERDALQERLVAAQARSGAVVARGRSLQTARGNAISGAGERIQMAEQRTMAARRAVEAAIAADRTAKVNLQRQQALNREGLAANRTLDLAMLDDARTRTEVARMQAMLEAAVREVSSLQADQLRLGADTSAAIEAAQADTAVAQAEIANTKAEIARLAVRLRRQQSQEITAPRDGTILRLSVNQGAEMVKAGDPIAVLVPDTDARAVELWISGNDVPLLREGRLARLQFEGWPAVQFSGWPLVAVGTFGGRVALVDAADNNKGMFRVLIVPDGEPWPESRYLRQGIRAQGWIMLDRVRLIYELWRQFNGFPPTVSQDAGDGRTKEPAALGPVKRR